MKAMLKVLSMIHLTNLRYDVDQEIAIIVDVIKRHYFIALVALQTLAVDFLESAIATERKDHYVTMNILNL